MTHAEAVCLEQRIARDMRSEHRALLIAFATEGYEAFHTPAIFYFSAVGHGLMTVEECDSLQDYMGERWYASNIE